MRNGVKPVSVAGIEFDALISETKTLSATVPAYPVEDGFPVSDAIILDPLTVSMTLYVSNTPVTWLYRHGTAHTRVTEICNLIENLWLSREAVKIVTTEAIYVNMGITNLSIKKSHEIGYAREISLTAQKIRVTSVQTADIPSYILKSGETKASAGAAATSKTSKAAKSSGKTASASGTAAGSNVSGSAGTATASSKSASSGSKTASSAKKSASVLYGIASGLKFL